MNKVVVLGGAGGMGSVAVKDLVLNGQFEEIVIADANEAAARTLASEIGSEKVIFAKIDVMDTAGLVELLQGATVVINFVGPFYRFAPLVIRAAIEAKVHYVDICDDFDAAEAILAMDEEVKKAGITVLTGMGTSPGITNILARMGMDELDKTEEIDTIWVMGESETGTAVLYHVFHGGSGLVPGFAQGERTKIKPFSEEGALSVVFPAPLGTVKVYDIGHPEPITIPHFFPEVKRVTNKGALLPSKVIENFKRLLDLGFGSTKPIEMDGATISPRDFAVKYLQANPDLLAVDEPFGFGGLKVIVKGMKDGQAVTYVYTTVSSEKTGESVAIPAAVGAELIATGKVAERGVVAPELLDPMVVFSALGKRKKLSNNVINSGLIIEKIDADGSVETVRAGKSILVK